MPQALLFYKANFFAQEVARNVPTSNVLAAVKSLFRVRDDLVLDMIDTYFESLILERLNINYKELMDVEPNYEKEVDYIFDPSLYSFCMVNTKNWAVIEKVVKGNIELILNNSEEKDLSKKLNQVHLATNDYILLRDLFHQNLLFAQVD